MALGQYRYEELSSETRFRLFRFENSQPCSAACPSELRIHLFDVDFADPPPFEAISYAWGHHTASSAIMCNGQELLITPNVEAILRALAIQPDSVGTFWIDSICINQMSIPEKNVQVPRMRFIYSEARVVWVWLGADSFETKTAFKFLVETAGVIEKSEDIAWSSSELTNLSRRFRDQVCETRGYYDSVDTNFIVDLVNLPWFHRTWTIQELVLAENAILICDNAVLPWSSFISILKALQTQEVFNRKLYSRSNPPSFYEDTECYRRLISLLWRTEGPTPISAILRLARPKSAAKALDKVYGLYGILDYKRVNDVPKVDYNCPVHLVYADITTAAIQHEKSLEILYQVCLPACVPYLPSWVPDFSNSSYFHPMRITSMKASGFSRPVHSFNGYQLSVSGILIDPLSEVAISTSFVMASFRRGYKARFIVEETQQRHTGVIDLIRTMQAWIKLSQKLHSYPTGEIPSEVFYRVIGQGDARISESLECSSARTSLQKWFDTMTCTFSDDPSVLQSLLDEVRSVPEYDAMLNDYATLFDRGTNIDTWPDELKIRFILRLASPEVALMQHDFFLNTYHRTFFITQDGYMGIGPRWARAGDSVALISGLKTPFIVRDLGEQFTLIGPAYIEGMMLGERWDDSEVWTMTLV